MTDYDDLLFRSTKSYSKDLLYFYVLYGCVVGILVKTTQPYDVISLQAVYSTKSIGEGGFLVESYI